MPHAFLERSERLVHDVALALALALALESPVDLFRAMYAPLKRGLASTPCPRRRELLQRVAASFVFMSPLQPAAAGATSAEASAAGAELREAERRASLCSASNVAGTGLRGEYYADDKASGKQLLVRVDGTVDFDRSLDWPATAAGPHPRSAQWTGWIKAPITGRYRFHTNQPMTTLVVARQSMLGPEGKDGESIELTAGRFYPVTLRVERLDSLQGRLALEWTAPFGARYVVPRQLLYVPTGS
jgi:hypothetical protein